jgi:hypothetical protein
MRACKGQSLPRQNGSKRKQPANGLWTIRAFSTATSSRLAKALLFSLGDRNSISPTTSCRLRTRGAGPSKAIRRAGPIESRGDKPARRSSLVTNRHLGWPSEADQQTLQRQTVVPPSAAEGFDRVCRVAVVGYQRLDEQMRLKLPLIWSHVFMPPKTCEFPPLLTVFSSLRPLDCPKKGILLRKLSYFRLLGPTRCLRRRPVFDREN